MEDCGDITRTERQLLVSAIDRIQEAYDQLGSMIKALDALGQIIKSHGDELDDHRRRICNLEQDVSGLKKVVGL